jgi:type IV pilus assembly protein PilQ
MLIGDGETSVIGGIYTRNTGLSYSKVPWFADIPIIGILFKNKRENDDRTEVLIFLTPRITNKASLTCEAPQAR